MKSIEGTSRLILSSCPLASNSNMVLHAKALPRKLSPIRADSQMSKELGILESTKVKGDNDWHDERQTGTIEWRNKAVMSEGNQSGRSCCFSRDINGSQRKTKNSTDGVKRLTKGQLERKNALEKSSLEDENSEEARLKQKMIFVEKWIKDCERSRRYKASERKKESIDLAFPAWMQTAVEMRKVRQKRASNGPENETSQKRIEHIGRPQSDETLITTGRKKVSNTAVESIVGRYLDASVEATNETCKAKRKRSSLLVREIKTTGVDLSNILENFSRNVFVSCCFESDAERKFKSSGILKVKDYKKSS